MYYIYDRVSPTILPENLGHLEVTTGNGLAGKGLGKKQMPSSNNWDRDYISLTERNSPLPHGIHVIPRLIRIVY